MNREDYMRAATALAALKFLPDTIADTLMSDASFRSEYGLALDADLVVGAKTRFNRSALFNAARKSFRRTKKLPSVDDESGRTWRVESTSDPSAPQVALVSDDARMELPLLGVLSSNRETRANAFTRQADYYQLATSERVKWEAILKVRIPTDDEVVAIKDDFNETPLAARNTIVPDLRQGTASVNVLAPRSRRYYERLVGGSLDIPDIETYVTDWAIPRMRELIRSNAADGYFLSLQLCAHPRISAGLATLEIGNTDLATVYDRLVRQGDALARAAAIEIGFKCAEKAPELAEPLARLIRATVAAAPVCNVDPYELLSALTILVYGQMAEGQFLSPVEPSWRRLAAIVQATQIARCLANVNADATTLLEWARHVRGLPFAFQALADLRREPAFTGEGISATHLRCELAGRIWLAANMHRSYVTDHGLQALLLDDVEGSLTRELHAALVMSPGPLEGAAVPQADVPEEQLAQMRVDLTQTPASSSMLIEMAVKMLLFRVPAEMVSLLADAIAKANYFVGREDDDHSLQAALIAVSRVAAVLRNESLADTVFTVLRRYRRFHQKELPPDACLYIGLIAAASRQDLSRWCKAVGDCLTDVAFQEITRAEAAALHASVTLLCRLVPELWATCGQAEAALQSVARM